MKYCGWRSSTVELPPCKREVVSSILTASSGRECSANEGGGMPERTKGADCKSAGERLRRFESSSPHFLVGRRRGMRGRSSMVEHWPSKPAMWVRSPSPALPEETVGLLLL